MKSPTDTSTSTTTTTTTTTVKDITNTAMASAGGEGSKNKKTVAAKTNNHVPQQLNLETCSPNDLSEYLLHQRFDDDRNKTQTFLEEAIKSVATGTATVSSSSPPSSDGLVQKLPAIELGPALLAEPLESSLLLPRAGKFHIQFHKNGLLAKKLNDNTVTLYVPSSNVKHVILFAKPEDIKTICNVNKSKKPKPPNAHLVLLQLSKPVPFQKKEIHQVCFALSYTKTDGPTGPKLLMDNNCDGTTATTETEGSSSWEVVTREWRESVLEKSFPNAVWSQVYPTTTTISKQQPFRSVSDPGLATTTGNMPFVKCYHGVQDGVLYPLEEGLLFFKPPKFFPRSQLHSISCGRGGGTSNSSRYVDMHLSLNDGEEETEFTNIQREEVGVLNKYIHEILIPAMKRDIQNDEKEPAVEEVNDQGGGDDNDDDIVVVATKDNDDDNDDTEEEDDDDEEDADYQGHDDGEDGESDDDDENFQDDDDGSDKDVDHEDDDDDDGGGIEVVRDEYAMELAKRKKEDSATESDESEGVSSRLKRRRC